MPTALATTWFTALTTRHFLKMCRSFTDQRADGLGMLLAQAARQFELWTGLYPDPFAQLIAFGRSPDSCR